LYLAAFSGSNARIWRVIINGILNGTITAQDTLIIQYTELTREEFWCKSPNEDYSHGGGLIRAKLDSHKKKVYSMYAEFLKLWSTEHLNYDYQLEKFRVYDAMFQGFLLSKGFDKVVFIKNVYNEKFLAPVVEYLPYMVDVCEVSKKAGNWDNINDPLAGLHLTQQGHDEVARALAEHLRVHFSK